MKPPQQKIAHFDDHARFYDIVIKTNPRYLAMLDFHLASLDACDDVLDSGAGTGNLTLPLLQRGKRVCAVDNSDDMITQLREKCKEYSSRFEIRKRDLTQPLDFPDGSFDGTASCYVVPYVNEPVYFSENCSILLLFPNDKLN
ncbi:MAG: class I SAM-dependent methyltransferase [archaeon]